MNKLTKSLGLLAMAGLALTGCKKELDTYFTPQDAAGGYLSLNAANTGRTNSPINLKYAPGEVVPIYANFNLGDNPTSITVFQATKTDSAQVGTYPVSNPPLVNNISVQQVAYTVPTTYAIGTSVRVDFIMNFQNGGQRTKSFRYQVANAPTLTNGTPTLTYRNGLGASAQQEGDLIGYALTLNAGGISTSTTPVPNLFKNVDSLVYYARTGTTGALQRQGVIKTPTAGVANSRTIDMKIPAGSAAAGGAQFVFTAYAQNTTTTLTSALVPVAAAATPLATTRRGIVSLGAGSSPDSLAFNLLTGLNEPAANPVTGKDLQVSAISSTGALSLSAPNATRYYKLTPTQLAAMPYATATANQVGMLSYQNTAGTDLGAPDVGDVYAVRVRGTTPMLLRIVGLRPGTSGSVGRVKFEYRSL